MSRNQKNSAFLCAHCGKEVLPLTNGSYRNHCPHCLYSLHVDIRPGDRQCACHGLMKPVGVLYHGKKGCQILHRCETCGAESRNIVAANTRMPDEFDALLALYREGLSWPVSR